MTIDLNMMIDLRDLQVALDVAQRAEMGWFDIEFTMYGCAYWAKGKRYYKLSAYQEKIYAFIEEGAKNDVITSDICALTRKYPVPTGMREYIALEVKKELAREMARQFPADFFRFVEKLMVLAIEETAMPFLLQQWQTVYCSFDAEKLRFFREMVDDAYLSRKLSRGSYLKMQELISEEQKSMEDNFVVKDILEKTFYGLVYEAQDQLKYVINARPGIIYQKKSELEMQGIFTSMVYHKTYYYNYDRLLTDVHKAFEQELKEQLTLEHMRALQAIYKQHGQISKAQFASYMQDIQEKYGQAAAQTLRHYGYRWGILW